MTKNIFTLNSHSGDTIKLTAIHGQRRIVKTSKTQKERLKICANIQINEAKKTKQLFKISAVPILQIEETAVHCRVTMPYMRGMSGQNVYLYLTPNEISSISQNLNNYVLHNLAQCKNGYSVDEFKDLVNKKIHDIQIGIAKNQNYTLSPSLNIIVLSEVSKIINQITNKCPVGKCHGDLTFSNIIYDRSNNQIWLIDYLDSFIKTPYIDLAKLVQEYRHTWSARYLQPTIQKNATLAGLKSIKSLTERHGPLDPKYLKVFSILNLYRIAPYIRDQATHNWLEKSLIREIECKYLSPE
ncbi:phosphotransferase [Planktomarina temperata]|nr:phosphotransferase [Planktomarina temperata]